MWLICERKRLNICFCLVSVTFHFGGVKIECNCANKKRKLFSIKESNKITCEHLNLPSLKYCVLRLRLFNSRTSSGVIFLNGWFNATMCIEKPNTNMASTTKKRPKSFIKSPMMIAHGPNRWWNDKKSNIWTHASRNDRAKHWFRMYINVGQYSTRMKNMPTSSCWIDFDLVEFFFFSFCLFVCLV